MIEATSKGLSEYEREVIAMRGDGRFKTDREMIDCCALGLAEECGEAVEAHIDNASKGAVDSELGDVLWYATTAAHRLDATLEIAVAHGVVWWPRSRLAAFALMFVHASRFAGRVKKWLYHDKPLDHAACLRDIGSVVLAVDYLTGRQNAANANVSKLRKRFPSGGFTAAEANARADEGGAR